MMHECLVFLLDEGGGGVFGQHTPFSFLRRNSLSPALAQTPVHPISASLHSGTRAQVQPYPEYYTLKPKAHQWAAGSRTHMHTHTHTHVRAHTHRRTQADPANTYAYAQSTPLR